MSRRGNSHEHLRLPIVGGEAGEAKAPNIDPNAGLKNVKCLLTHKCGAETHALANRMREVFHQQGVELLIDPFRTGNDINTRIATFGIDALVFLSSPESCSSAPCCRELAAAQGRGLPLFAVQLEGAVPQELSTRIYPSLIGLERTPLEVEVRGLATSVHHRASLFRRIESVSVKLAEQAIRTAQEIFDEEDRTILAEFVPHLGAQYLRVQDPSVQFWVANALGKAATPEAGALLLDLLRLEDHHPYARRGLVNALEAVCRELPTHPITEQANELIKQFAARKETL